MEYDDVEGSFSCRIDNLKAIGNVLSCLTDSNADLSKDQVCHIEATKEELKFTVVGLTKSTQAWITLPTQMFEEFVCEVDIVKFSVHLPVLIDCFQMFGTSTENIVATLTYSGIDALFKISLEDISGIVITCDILPIYLENDDVDETANGLFAAFRSQPENCQIILKSDAFRDAMHDLTELVWAGPIQFIVHSDSNIALTLSTGENTGVSEIQIPRSSDAFVSFNCKNAIAFSYPLSSMLLGMKALSVSKETYIRINSSGIMCVQHQIETPDRVDTYFDFLMIAQENFD
eukprot:gene5133-7149_t